MRSASNFALLGSLFLLCFEGKVCFFWRTPAWNVRGEVAVFFLIMTSQYFFLHLAKEGEFSFLRRHACKRDFYCAPVCERESTINIYTDPFESLISCCVKRTLLITIHTYSWQIYGPFEKKFSSSWSNFLAFAFCLNQTFLVRWQSSLCTTYELDKNKHTKYIANFSNNVVVYSFLCHTNLLLPRNLKNFKHYFVGMLVKM